MPQLIFSLYLGLSLHGQLILELRDILIFLDKKILGEIARSSILLPLQRLQLRLNHLIFHFRFVYDLLLILVRCLQHLIFRFQNFVLLELDHNRFELCNYLVSFLTLSIQ